VFLVFSGKVDVVGREVAGSTGVFCVLVLRVGLVTVLVLAVALVGEPVVAGVDVFAGKEVEAGAGVDTVIFLDGDVVD